MAGVLTRFWAVVLIVSAAGSVAAQDRPRVIAVHHALHELAERLLGDGAEVMFPVPDGVDPSFWRPSISDISTIQSADLILLNGAGFAAWVDRVTLPRSRIVDTSAGFEAQYIVTESITHSHGDGGEHSHEGLASYTWLDLRQATAQAEAAATAALARGIGDEADVKERLAALTSELSALDQAAMDALKPAQGVAMIATHPRYQYFARRYALSIASLDWDAGAMPTEDQLATLADLAKETGARVLIWEAQPPEDAVRAAEALGLKSVVFEPWASGGGNGSFLDAYKAAVSAIAEAVSDGS